jgi:hypothetical protein
MTYAPSKEVFGAELGEHWDDGLRFGLASGKLRVLILGDSGSRGCLTGAGANSYTDSWSVKLRNKIAAKMSGGLAGCYFPIIHNNTFVTAVGYPWLGSNIPWTQNVAPFALPSPIGFVLGGYTWAGSYGSLATWAEPTLDADLMTFTEPEALTYTDADILYPRINPGSPPGKYQVDAGTITAFPNLTGTMDGAINRIELRGLSTAAHTIKIKGAGAGTQLWLDGVNVYYNGPTANGLYWANTAVDATGLTTYPVASFTNWSGRSGTGGATDLGVQGFPACPHLVILGHGFGDKAYSNGLVFGDRTAMTIRMLRRAGELHYGSGFTTSVIVLQHSERDGGVLGFSGAPSEGGPATFDHQESWMQFMTQQRDVVLNLGVAWLSFEAFAKSRDITKGHTPNSTEQHYLPGGHTAVADFIYSVLPLSA